MAGLSDGAKDRLDKLNRERADIIEVGRIAEKFGLTVMTPDEYNALYAPVAKQVDAEGLNPSLIAGSIPAGGTTICEIDISRCPTLRSLCK
jgi:hypothetical protein